MKLYHYIHCPFCVRVRMGLGFLEKKYESVVIPYDDEITPVALTGKKMLPILVSDDGKAQDESLDILKIIDIKDQLNWKLFKEKETIVNSLLDQIGSVVHSMAMPYWIWTPEFTPSSRKYFQEKKEVKRGPFKELVKNYDQYTIKLHQILKDQLHDKLNPFYESDKLSVVDILIASHLWGMYIVPEFQFDELTHNYLQLVKKQSHFNYHEDYWR